MLKITKGKFLIKVNIAYKTKSVIDFIHCLSFNTKGGILDMKIHVIDKHMHANRQTNKQTNPPTNKLTNLQNYKITELQSYKITNRSKF